MSITKKYHCNFIGMLHVPVNSILASPAPWREALALPAATAADWAEFNALEKDFGDFLHNNSFTSWQVLDDSKMSVEMEKRAARFSFFPFLLDRVLTEAEIYFRHGADALMLENIAAPYFVRERQPVAIIAVMSLLAKRLRETYLEKRFGIQILAFSDDLAMGVALRHGFEFVRSESALFAGLRPEGYTPNYGNLAKLYMTRSRMMADLQVDGEGPLVFVDLQKKHTIFDTGLEFLDTWLDNILFQKLEGVIITGHSTGCPVAEQDLVQTRRAIQKIADKTQKLFGTSYAPPLIIGSGVSVNNIDICKRYADSVIVGSSLKRGGYWECELDEERLKKFAELWHAASKVKE
jgi:predicted TIM-barrel enzyme